MASIEQAVAYLTSSRLVVMPTETVYGLAALADDPVAVSRVFALKGRPATNPLIVHACGVAMARSCCATWPEPARRLAEALWPGPLTLVLPRARWVPDAVTAGGPTVAVRVPAHPVARALIEAVGRPVVAPSANRSGYVSPTRVEHVQGLWPRSQVLVLDGGPCEVGLESTVVAVGERSLSVLRPGVVGARRLAEVAGVPVEPRARGDRREDLGVPAEAGRAGPGAPVGSPGLVGPHYQPRAPVVLVRTAEQAGSALASASQRRQRAVVLGPPGGDFQAPSGHEVLAMPGEGRAYARVLYEALRRADEAGPGLIVVFEPTQPGEVWDAVRERLGRASGGGLGGASVGSSGGAGTAG